MNRQEELCPKKSSAKLLALALVLAGTLVALSLGGGAWATPGQNPFQQTVPTLTPTSAPGTPAPPSPPPPTPTAILPRPEETAVPTPFLLPTPYPSEEVIALPKGRATIYLPRGLLGPGETLGLRGEVLAGLAGPGGGLLPIAEAFILEGLNAAGRPLGELGQPITLRVAYGEEELAMAGGDPRNLLLAHYDQRTGNWRLLEASLDPLRRLLSAQVKSPGIYALMALQPTILPPTGSSDPERRAWPAALLGILALLRTPWVA